MRDGDQQNAAAQQLRDSSGTSISGFNETFYLGSMNNIAGQDYLKFPGQRTQLDRIEEKLDRLIKLLSATPTPSP